MWSVIGKYRATELLYTTLKGIALITSFFIKKKNSVLVQSV